MRFSKPRPTVLAGRGFNPQRMPSASGTDRVREVVRKGIDVIKKTGFIATLLAWAVMGCAGHDASSGQNTPSGKIIWAHRYQFVRLEPREHCKGATTQANDHPQALERGQLRAALAALRIDKPDEGKTITVFSQAEMETLIAPLLKAFNRAAPGEDIAIAIEGSHPGSLGYRRSVTTARLFIRGADLHVIFGNLHDTIDDYDSPLHIEPTDRRLQPFVPGSRCASADRAFPAIAPTDTVRLYDQAHGARKNWVVVGLAALPRSAEPPGKMALPPASDSSPGALLPAATDSEQVPGKKMPEAATPKEKEIEEKLQILKNLRDKNLITEQEYIGKKRKILDRL